MKKKDEMIGSRERTLRQNRKVVRRGEESIRYAQGEIKSRER